MYSLLTRNAGCRYSEAGISTCKSVCSTGTSFIRASANHCRQMPFQGDPADDRQMIPCLKDSQHRRLTTGRISLDHSGQQIECSFINTDNAAALESGLFLTPARPWHTSVRFRAHRAGWRAQAVSAVSSSRP